jgi:Fe-S oxidoreductase
MDLCLGCKGCKSECPSNVDVAKMKAEFLQGFYDANGVPRRTRIIASMERYSRIASNLPWLYNLIATRRVSSWLLKKFAGFHPKRTFPRLHAQTLRSWFKSHKPPARAGAVGKVLLFCDEFSNYYDVPIGIATVQLLECLGFAVEIPRHRASGRAAISSGLLRQAREIAEQNVRMLAGYTTEDQPLVGIEPSAILSFRDEYPSLVRPEFRNAAERLSGNTLLIEEFLVRQIDKGTINSGSFHEEPKHVLLHGHCFQKALGTLAATVRALQIPRHYNVRLIPSGCCGMAGSFGYETEHFDISMKIGELVLFPRIRREMAGGDAPIICAPGTSCRHQILDGTSHRALHPVEILRHALRDL